MNKIKQESIIIQVITLIIVFVFSFIIVFTINFYIEKVTSEYDRKIANSRAGLSLDEILSSKLFVIEDCNIKISSAENLTLVSYYSNKIFNAVDDFKEILKILQKGGTYNKVVAVNAVGENQIHEEIKFLREDDSYKIEIIELSSKIVEIDKFSRLIIKKVENKIKETDIEAIETNKYEIDMLLKQIDTYFRRSHESVNNTYYNNVIKINELRDEINKSKEELVFFKYLVFLLTFILVAILTRLVLNKIVKLITEKQNYLEKIEKSHKTIQDIFDAMPVGVILIDKNKEISKINRTALNIYGSDDYSSLLCLSCKSIFSVNQEKSCPYDDNLSLNEAEIDLITADGKKVPIFKNVIPIVINDEEFLLEAFMDMSAQREVESQLKIAADKAKESDQLKTEFIHNMTHEIRTPLNGILGFSNLLINPKISRKELKEHIDIIQASGNQLNSIIDDILEISALETRQTELLVSTFNINTLLLEQFSVFDNKAKEKNIKLVLENYISDDESVILADELKLAKIVHNLLDNAIRFTFKGGVELVCQIIAKNIKIQIKDTGIGIKPEYHKSIFDRFTQEEKDLAKNVGGLGLGLALAKENAELMGGDITLQSEKGVGSTFTLVLPYKMGDKRSVVNSKKNTVESSNGKFTILIAEDEIINYMFLSTLLKNINSKLEILHAKNGADAVAICNNNANIDMVLMDLKMPIMSGFEATTQIKELRPDLPIVAQTAYSSQKDKQKAFSCGCDDFMSKPIKREVLQAVIDRYLVNMVDC